MKNKDAIEKLAGETLASIDNIQASEPDEFIFTRIKSRMEAKRQQYVAGRIKLLYRLSAILVLFTALNLSSYYLLKRSENNTKVGNTSSIAAFANDYNLQQNSNDY
jgi:hypothetical protein